jgi:hypothetical protein
MFLNVEIIVAVQCIPLCLMYLPIKVRSVCVLVNILAGEQVSW